jgi:nitrogen-specific signal transduction histidine kinase
MSSLKTYAAITFLAGSPAAAFTNTADQQLHFFATCAGRLSALMEHQWTYDTAAVDMTTAQRSEMIDLVFAVMPENEGRSVLLMRVEAKHAQARLLHRAAVNHDPADAAWAQDRARALMTECTSVLITSNQP